jgi:nucleoside-diphosphate-sugar epimerase
MNKDHPVAVLTGLHGFIGSALAERLVEEGYEVVGIDHADLLNPAKLEKIFKDSEPDYVFHLAGYGNHNDHKEIDEIFNANVIKTYFLLRYATQSTARAIVNFSTQSVYGGYPFPLNESFKPLTRTFYGCTKVCGEYLAEAFSAEFDKPIITVRPFSVYGEGEASHRFIPTVIDSILTGKEFTLWAEPRHDWIYIQDFIDGVLRVLGDGEKHKLHSIYNLATGKSFSNLDVVKELEGIAGKTANFKLSEQKKRANNDNLELQSEITFLKDTGWKQQTPLRLGLTKVFNHIKGAKNGR